MASTRCNRVSCQIRIAALAAEVDRLHAILDQVRDIARNSNGYGAGRRLRAIHRIAGAGEELPIQQSEDLEGQMLIAEADAREYEETA